MPWWYYPQIPEDYPWPPAAWAWSGSDVDYMPGAWVDITDTLSYPIPFYPAPPPAAFGCEWYPYLDVSSDVYEPIPFFLAVFDSEGY
jgi:hypothetical protein